jgi:hypothetical protein
MVRFVEKIIGREDLRSYLYTFLSPETALVFEITCKDAKSNDAYWAGLVDRILVYSGPSETRLYRESGEVDSKGLFRALQIVSAESKINNNDEDKRRNLNLLPSHFKVRGCSSVDRREESPMNVQRPSFCHEMIMKLGFHGLSIPEGEVELNEYLSPMAKLQIQCGCAIDRPCYYCTKACDNSDAREWIDMCRSDQESAQGTLMQPMGPPVEFLKEGNLVCVAAFSLVVYRCYLQSGGPIFAPRAVQLQLWQGLDARDGKSSSRSRLCFESEEFPVQMHEEEQTFELSEPVFLPHSMIEGEEEETEFTIRVVLLGAQQRQTVPGAVDYYVCISQVKLLGSSMQHIVRSERRRSRGFSSSSSAAAALDRGDYDVSMAAQKQFLAGINNAKFSSRAVCQSDNHALRRGKTRINEFRK